MKHFPWLAVSTGAALGALLVSACRSEQSSVRSLSSRDDVVDAAVIARADAGASPTMPLPSEVVHPSPSSESDATSSEGVFEASSLEVADSDAGNAPRSDGGGPQHCEPGTTVCSETGERTRCKDDGSAFEVRGSCALELFDGLDSDAVYVRRADGQWAYLSDSAPPKELSDALRNGETVRRVVADTDPIARSSPWLIDLDDTLWHPLHGVAASAVVDAHVTHGFTVTVAADGSVTSLLSGVTLTGDFTAALGHEENLWLLSSDGRLSTGLNAFALSAEDWLPTLPDRYQRVFALDQELCGLRTDGEVDCTPAETWQGLVPEGPFVDLSCNFRTCYGLRNDGSVACWSAQFECVPNDGPFLDIATAAQLACGITEERSVRCWYHNGTALDAQWIDAAYR